MSGKDERCELIETAKRLLRDAGIDPSREPDRLNALVEDITDRRHGGRMAFDIFCAGLNARTEAHECIEDGGGISVGDILHFKADDGEFVAREGGDE